jgi:hypothetical protein
MIHPDFPSDSEIQGSKRRAAGCFKREGMIAIRSADRAGSAPGSDTDLFPGYPDCGGGLELAGPEAVAQSRDPAGILGQIVAPGLNEAGLIPWGARGSTSLPFSSGSEVSLGTPIVGTHLGTDQAITDGTSNALLLAELVYGKLSALDRQEFHW